MRKVEVELSEDLYSKVERIANEGFRGDVTWALKRIIELGVAHWRGEFKHKRVMREHVKALTRQTFTYRFADYDLWWEFTPTYNEFLAVLLRRSSANNFRAVAAVLGSRDPVRWRILWKHDSADKGVLLELLEFQLKEILDAEV